MKRCSSYLTSPRVGPRHHILISKRVLVTIAGVAPDVDALGLAVELMVQYSGNSPTWWSDYHHVLGYKVGSGLVVKFFACWLANRRSVATLLALAAFHQRLLCDLFGSRGPDGYQWPIPYLLPFSDRFIFPGLGQGIFPSRVHLEIDQCRIIGDA